MTDGPPWLQLPLCCLPPPPTFLWIFGSPGEWPEGTGWSVLVALKSCWQGKNETGRYGPNWNQGPISPALSETGLRKSARKIFPSLLRVPPSAVGSLGAGGACLEILIYLTGTVVSSSLIECSNTLVPVKCVDFVKCAQKEYDVQRSRVTQSRSCFHDDRLQAIFMAGNTQLTDLRKHYSQRLFSSAYICLSCSLSSLLLFNMPSTVNRISGLWTVAQLVKCLSSRKPWLQCPALHGPGHGSETYNPSTQEEVQGCLYLYKELEVSLGYKRLWFENKRKKKNLIKSQILSLEKLFLCVCELLRHSL